MGSWGGSGFAALFGGLMAANIGWRWIFFAAVAISIIGLLMMRGTPESKASSDDKYKFDIPGVLTFMVMMIGYQVVATQGGNFGWTSPLTLGILLVSIIATVIFIQMGKKNSNSFIDFKLFKNMTYTGATISNFLLNATAGILIIAMTLIQLGGNLNAQQAGMLTLGYAISIVAFIRVGERLLRKYGPRKPMIWGSLIVILSILILMPTHFYLDSYQWIEGVISYIGRQDNIAIREAAFFAFGVNLIMAIAALISIMLTIPKK